MFSLFLGLESQLGLATDQHHRSIKLFLFCCDNWSEESAVINKRPALLKNNHLERLSLETALRNCRPEGARLHLKLVAVLGNTYENLTGICFEHTKE